LWICECLFEWGKKLNYFYGVDATMFYSLV